MPLDLGRGPVVRQEFRLCGPQIERHVEIDGVDVVSSVKRVSQAADARLAYYASILSERAVAQAPARGRVTFIDLFCGGGGLSIGVSQALSLLGFSPKLVMAADIDPIALELVKRQFKPLLTRSRPVEELVEYFVDYSGAEKDFVSPPTLLDRELGAYRGKIDLLIGGPPCQGHSNLNNRTRRNDPRNLLYFVMPALAIALDVPRVLIENVPSIERAHEEVVPITRRIFEAQGYIVQEIVLNASEFAVAQTRSRHFLLATKRASLDVFEVARYLKGPPITFSDINSGVPKLKFESMLLEKNGTLSRQNNDRIDFLHNHDLYDLPNHQRPDCHKESHTYPSVYGRIYADQPAQTVTTGFQTPGRGRYVHPTERRTINIREAARVQSFPDWYWEPAASIGFSRVSFHKVVGDAVPPLLVEPLIFSMFGAQA